MWLNNGYGVNFGKASYKCSQYCFPKEYYDNVTLCTLIFSPWVLFRGKTFATSLQWPATIILCTTFKWRYRGVSKSQGKHLNHFKYRKNSTCIIVRWYIYFRCRVEHFCKFFHIFFSLFLLQEKYFSHYNIHEMYFKEIEVTFKCSDRIWGKKPFFFEFHLPFLSLILQMSAYWKLHMK